MTAEETALLAALKANPKDVTARAAYADWLDEHGRPYDAALQRADAGLSEVLFKVRRKSDGLFSEGRAPSRDAVRWSAKGKVWRRANDVRAHMLNMTDKSTYGGTPWDDVEVVMHEVRVVFTATLPVVVARNPLYGRVTDVALRTPVAGDAT